MDRGIKTYLRRFAVALLVLALLIAPAAVAETVIDNRGALVAHLAIAAIDKPTEIEFTFDESLYDSIADQDWFVQVIYDAGILHAGWRYGATSCTVHSIEYMPPYTYCGTADQVLTALGSMKGEGNIRLSPELYAELSANDFEALRNLEGRAGMLNRSMSYYSDAGLILYTEIVFAEKLMTVTNREEFKQAMVAQTDKLTRSFTIQCSDELYKQFVADEFAFVHEVEDNCGIMTRNMSYYDRGCMLEYKNVQYYPGMRIVKLVQAGHPELLTADETRLYQAALGIIERAMADAPHILGLEVALHDAIADNCVYQLNDVDGEFVAEDTAYGPLLMGQADCDGYADAFYLLGNLAGFNVRYQHGDSLDDDEDDVAHMWNIIELNGQWYFVDVTWDDDEPYGHYIFLNFAADQGSTRYTWDADACIVPPAKTTNRFYGYHESAGTYFTDMAEAQAYVNAQLRAGEKRINIVVVNDTYADDDAFNEVFREGISGFRSNRTHMGNLISYVFRPYE